MEPIILHLFNCGDGGLNQSIELDESDEKQYNIIDRMPLIIPFTEAEAKANYPQTDFYQASRLHYENFEPLLNAHSAGIRTFPIAGSTDVLEFEEFQFTWTINSPQDVYAITTGYLYYLQAGQSVPNLAGGIQVPQNEHMLVLVPFSAALDSWKNSHPGKVSLLQQCIYANLQLPTDNQFKLLISKRTTEKIFQKLYKKIHGVDPPATNDWPAQYLDLVKNNPTVPIIVQGGEIIGSTNPGLVNPAEQILKMHFLIGDSWKNEPIGGVETFFRYFRRRFNLTGHPLIAKLLNVPVWASYADVIVPESSFGTRTKDSLDKAFRDMFKQNAVTHHPLALDPDQHPHHLVVTHLQPTLLQISNLLGLTIRISGTASPGLNLFPLEFSDSKKVVEIQLNGPLPIAENAFLILTGINEMGMEAEMMQIRLIYWPEVRFPVKFHKLRNDPYPYITDINEVQLLEVIDYANAILLHQTRVQIDPVAVNAGHHLHDLHFDEGDLRDPSGEGFHLSGIEDLWQMMRVNSNPDQINVIFIWDQAYERVGVTYQPDGLLFLHGEFYFMILIDTKKQTGFDANPGYLAKILVHEIGHWLSKHFIKYAGVTWNDWPNPCTGKEIHFTHEKCPGGDWTLRGNLMTKDEHNIWITYDQASVYSEFAVLVKP